MHAVIYFRHITYCYTTWSHIISSVVKPIMSLFDKKPSHDISNLDSYQIYHYICLILKVFKGLSPPPLGDFIQERDSEIQTY